MTSLEWQRRPWGKWTVVYTSPETTVKLLVVDPGEALSLQYHRQRSESWVVLDGIPTLIIGEAGRIPVTLTGRPNVRYDVPPLVNHRIENRENVPARILEVIQGRYDENDIVRLHDRYERKLT